MIIRRASRPRHFAIIDMALMNDQRLTAEALGVLLYLLSKPDDWRVSIDELKARFGVGKDKMQGIMRVLRDASYARLERIHDADTGRLIGQGYSIHDEPQESEPKQAAPADVVEDESDGATCGYREPENPALGETATESRENRQPDLPAAGKPGSLLNTESNLILNLTYPPKPPEPGGGQATRFWDRFDESWRWNPLESKELARRAFGRLDAVDQDRAARFAARYCDLARLQDRRLPNASSWLSRRGWENLANAANASAPPSQVQIWAGTPQAAAWARYEGKSKLFMADLKRPDGSRALGCYRPTEWPPPKSASASAKKPPELEQHA